MTACIQSQQSKHKLNDLFLYCFTFDFDRFSSKYKCNVNIIWSCCQFAVDHFVCLPNDYYLSFVYSTLMLKNVIYKTGYSK